MNRPRGFTLIEVLVALAVAAIGLAGVLAVVSNASSNAASLRDRTFAGWVAANRLTELRLAQTMPSVDRTTGDAELANLRWEWETTVIQTQVPGIRRVDVRVRLADGPDDAWLATLSGFVGRTQVSAPGAPLAWDPETPPAPEP
ncbi:MAG: type II secretion system minor pseudopilin GspI [Steroidobacteraceae bacterium]|nr:type II secretion system minor pseudopilin GspI [Steroidobacteraceae bacterium]